jgi:hypothetical protein
MRLRFAVLALLWSAIVIVSMPATALAHRVHGPLHNHGLTIAATPNPITAGEGVLIYGQLNVHNPGGQVINLFHRINPSRVFTLISNTTTDSHGFYEFTRPEGIVQSNRSWFVTAPNEPINIHSRTIHELVSALVTLTASAPLTADGYDTGQPITFTGHVQPNHAGEQVLLQKQVANGGNDWVTIDRGTLGPASNYQITHRFRVPGDYELRTLFRGDVRNIAGASDSVTIAVQQAEVPDFTANTSAPLIQYGQSATISGVLYVPGTTTPDPNVSVTLWGRSVGQRFHTIGFPVITRMDGSYSFSVTPTNNTVYQVRTTFRPPKTRRTALLFEGVQDVVTIVASSLTGVVGGTDQFFGVVSPDKAGHIIYLQRLGADGDWHTIEVSFVKPNSTYSFTWRFGNPGTKEFRARITGGPANLGGASPPVTLVVTLPPVSSLPPGS